MRSAPYGTILDWCDRETRGILIEEFALGRRAPFHEVYLAPLVPGRSTTAILERLRAEGGDAR